MSGRTEDRALDEENAHPSVASSTTARTTPSPDTDTRTDADTWTYSSWLHEYENAKASRDIKKKHLALTWQNLTVTGVDSKAVLGDNIISYANPLEYFKSSKQNANTITIINNFNGQVKPGEMMLVLGRPGSGCTSFLRTVANKRKAFKHVDGEVFYGSMSSQEAHRYRGTILYNSEEDMHFPTLTVAQTLALVIKTRVARHFSNRKSAKGHIKELLQVFPKALGISHTHSTLVGNEFVRGVSGGERKRVSIGEVIAAQGSITCWDNPTRGLDASSALEFNRTLRSMADKAAVTVLVTLYQAGNGIFDLYDTVLVIDSGHQIYYGPRVLAKKYFQDLGFICPSGANTADFLTSVTVPTERQIKPGYENTVPTTPADFEKIYLQSTIALEMRSNATPPTEFAESTALAKEAYHEEQPKFKSPIQSSYTVALHTQITACVVRQIQIFSGDKMSMCLQQISAMLQALVSGSLYYNLPATSAGLFTRSGALFFPIVLSNVSLLDSIVGCTLIGMYRQLTALSEVTASFMGRPILARHRDFSLYRPTAYVIARMITDIPITVLSCSIFSVVYYFMCGFQTTGGKFFTFWLLCIITALTFTAMYRAIGSLFRKFNDASKISGLWAMAMLVYAGYFIPYQNMHPWFRWIFWLSPAAYSYEAIMGNEFGGLKLDCVGAQLIPNGPNYSPNTNRVCTVAGASSDGSYIVGADYIHQTYDYQAGHVWRNFGILCAWWIVFTIATALALERPDDNHAASSLVYKRGSATHDSIRKVKDEEKVSTGFGDDSTSSAQKSSDESTTVGLVRNEAIFTWENLSYTVSVPGGQRKLLDEIFGWVKPGTLGALMGSSGAGKTTLLDVLAQRKDAGIIEGSILVDGRPLPVSFQRSAGYCEQMDVHEPTATVREALIFSARLRQPSETSDQEKRDYVDSIVDLLELHDIQDAIIGVPGAGLTIEQRKRVTIGVELAAKPSILLFLDEPTSGLDGQSAFNVIRFLRRLTAAGQAVLCTIHQPSASLFEAFDTLLLLAKGGKTVYFGETGTNSSTLLEYFSRNGAPCHADVNPAEHIIDVVSGVSGGGRDWNSVWLNSTERKIALQTLEELKSYALSKDATVNDDASDFATPLSTQLQLVTYRQQVAIWRNPDYVWNKIFLHVSAALFSGFTFWMMGTAVADLQLRLLAVFNFLFVAIGVINQLQPLFLHNRDIFEAREKKSKMYSWLAFVTAQLVAEIPYLVVCGTLYFACWYFTAGLPVKASTSGQIYLIMILYEFLYTALGQAIAAISPNEFFAALLNPLILGAFLINFAGVLVPYSQIVVFWKYWLYYLNPFTYLTGGLLTQLLYDIEVTCLSTELAVFSPPANKTCGDYMSAFFETGIGYIVDNSSTTECQYCAYRDGAEYARTLNLNARYYGWRDTGIVALFCISTYGVVFFMMKLRSKKTKSAKSE